MKTNILKLTALCMVCMLFSFSCQTKINEDEQLLSPEQISTNLLKSEFTEIDPALLIGEWNITKFAYTADGKKISNVATISNCAVDIRDGFLLNEDDELLGNELFSVYFKICLTTYSISNNKIVQLIRSDCWAINVPWTSDEIEIDNALKNAYSFVIIDNELLIYFTGVKNKNLLILTKR